jgi:hypothetical protein
MNEDFISSDFVKWFHILHEPTDYKKCFFFNYDFVDLGLHNVE